MLQNKVKMPNWLAGFKDNPSYFSTILLGNNLVNIAAASWVQLHW
jgi:Mg2+/Co2+ transporter CorB